jgi:hypothetical protein
MKSVLVTLTLVFIFSLSALTAEASKKGGHRTPAGGASAPAINDIACIKQFFGALDHWEIPRNWHQVASYDPTMKIMTSLTDSPGITLEARIYPDRTIAYRRSPASVTEISWKEPDCTPAIGLAGQHNVKVPNSFTDDDLQALLAKSKVQGTSGLFYFWSPHMPYSVTGLNEVKKAARDMHLDLTVLLDPKAIPKFAKEEQAKHHFTKSDMKLVESNDLLSRGILQHYPSYLMYSRGKIVGHWVPGYITPPTINQVIARELHASN